MLATKELKSNYREQELLLFINIVNDTFPDSVLAVPSHSTALLCIYDRALKPGNLKRVRRNEFTPDKNFKPAEVCGIAKNNAIKHGGAPCKV